MPQAESPAAKSGTAARRSPTSRATALACSPAAPPKAKGEEGCLSLPGLQFDCVRHLNVVAHGQNEYGDPVVLSGSDLLARCVQHETDHLDGVLFIDRLDPETKRLAMEAVREAEWANEPAPVVKASPHPLFGRAR